jgi:tRNA dimethylallyltransferase
MKPKLIAVVGPTASGKSALGVFLAQKLNGEVVSADSRQVYRGLDIGTGKVTKKEMGGVPHHLLNVASPTRRFTADDFVKQASKKITMIYHSKKLPIVVGGTGFYIDALVGRMPLPNVPPDPALRATLAQKSPAQLVAQLRRLDPASAARVDPRNMARLVRAIEIAKALGAVPVLPLEQRYNVLWLGLKPKDLDARIAARLRARLRAGMVAEAKRLHKAGLSYKRMEELGLEYRHLARLLRGTLTKEQFVERLECEIRRYAKRQMRWFKRNPDIHWIKNKTESLRLAKKFLSR